MNKFDIIGHLPTWCSGNYHHFSVHIPWSRNSWEDSLVIVCSKTLCDVWLAPLISFLLPALTSPETFCSLRSSSSSSQHRPPRQHLRPVLHSSHCSSITQLRNFECWLTNDIYEIKDYTWTVSTGQSMFCDNRCLCSTCDYPRNPGDRSIGGGRGHRSWSAHHTLCWSWERGDIIIKTS